MRLARLSIHCIDQNKFQRMHTIIYLKPIIRWAQPAHRPSLEIADKIDLQGGNKRVALSELSIYYTWQNVRNSNKNNSYTLKRLGGDSVSTQISPCNFLIIPCDNETNDVSI